MRKTASRLCARTLFLDKIALVLLQCSLVGGTRCLGWVAAAAAATAPASTAATADDAAAAATAATAAATTTATAATAAATTAAAATAATATTTAGRRDQAHPKRTEVPACEICAYEAILCPHISIHLPLFNAPVPLYPHPRIYTCVRGGGESSF
jgi:hypothetical protein